MSAAQTTGHIPAPAQSSTRLAAAFYLLTIVTGLVVLSFGGGAGVVTDLLATGFYIAMIALFQRLSRRR
ncbi:MAG: hypothetical protein JO249_22955 [Acidobacteria bacterium]|nr:hypothetical protein [Acidobacteriota bacterium]